MTLGAAAGIRTSAAHARWDLGDVARMIELTKAALPASGSTLCQVDTG